MVWTHSKISRTYKDDPTGNDTRREKERQTEKEMGRQHIHTHTYIYIYNYIYMYTYNIYIYIYIYIYISEWTDLKLGEVLRKAQNREEWRKAVARSSLMPQRSFRLVDKWSDVKVLSGFSTILGRKLEKKKNDNSVWNIVLWPLWSGFWLIFLSRSVQ